jgi:cyclic di-GMP phosphodiesterase Gmr
MGVDRGGADTAGLATAAVAATDALVLVLRSDGRVLLANPAVVRTLGWQVEELSERPFWETYVVPEDVSRAQDAFGRSFREGRAYPQEGDWQDRSGGRRRIFMQNTVMFDEHGVPYALVTVGVDVTEQRRREAALRRQAETDHLTGLANRGAFFEALGEALGPAGPGAGVLFCDLDGFKRANDEHGHAVGDLLLVEVAKRLRAVTGMQDLVARVGGDELVILCRGAGQERLDRLVRRVEDEVGRPIETERGAVRLGVSVGTALGVAGDDPDELVRVADRRMYRVKSRRRIA